MPVHTSLKEYRQKHNLTQAELGEAVGVSRQTIISIEKGQYTPSLPLSLQLAKYFEVKIEELFSLN